MLTTVSFDCDVVKVNVNLSLVTGCMPRSQTAARRYTYIMLTGAYLALSWKW